jgi:hypothetical protein
MPYTPMYAPPSATQSYSDASAAGPSLSQLLPLLIAFRNQQTPAQPQQAKQPGTRPTQLAQNPDAAISVLKALVPLILNIPLPKNQPTQPKTDSKTPAPAPAPSEYQGPSKTYEDMNGIDVSKAQGISDGIDVSRLIQPNYPGFPNVAGQYSDGSQRGATGTGFVRG